MPMWSGGAVRAVGVAKRYGNLQVLDNVTFDVKPHEFVCLLGPSGCGKTTLIRIAAGLTKAEAGAIYIDDQPVEGPGVDRSMVFQTYGLLPWRTVLGNVELGLEVQGMAKSSRRRIARSEIERIGLHGFEHHYPHELSGGMQQRVGLARALSKNPKLLLMDEPFAAVDAQTRELLQEQLLEVWSTTEATVLFVTHGIEEAIYLADRILVMQKDPGKIGADIAIDLARPRSQVDTKSSPKFAEYQRVVREALRPADERLTTVMS